MRSPDTTPEHQFEVVARAYYKLVAMNIRTKINLQSVGRDTFGLSDDEVHRIRLRARYFADGLKVPDNVDAKGWFWPTRKEQESAA